MTNILKMKINPYSCLQHYSFNYYALKADISINYFHCSAIYTVFYANYSYNSIWNTHCFKKGENIFLIIKKENNMSLIKWNPNRSIMSPFSEWDNFLDEFFGNSVEYKRSSWIPNVDIHENKIDFTLSMDLPGLSKKEVSLNVDDSVLTIAGERSYSDKSADARRIERGYGKFKRSFSLPDNVNASKINASFKNGELIVSLPKAEETLSKSKEIKIS